MRIPSSPDAPANPKVEGTDARASLFTEFDAMPDNFADEIIAIVSVDDRKDEKVFGWLLAVLFAGLVAAAVVVLGWV